MTLQHCCFGAAFVLLPLCYVALCVHMGVRGVRRAPYVPFFCIFGSYGGWPLALLLSPSGVAALSLLFLLTLAPLSLVGSAAWSWQYRKLSGYHWAAFWGSLSYFAFMVSLPLIAFILCPE